MRRLGVALSIWALLPVSSASFATEFEQGSAPAITILVFNSALAPLDLLGRSEHEADRIFKRAGVRMTWVNCSDRQADLARQETCKRPFEIGSVRLNLLALPPSRRPLQNDVLGSATPPNFVTVFYDYRARFEHDDLALGLPMVLGAAIAHEIGHLLLGPQSHSARGVMQAEWGQKQFVDARLHTLIFSEREARLLRAAALRRILSGQNL